MLPPPSAAHAAAAVPTAAAIADARRVIGRVLPVTPLVPAAHLTRRLGAPVYLKLECNLPTGSFKPRGALYALERMLRERQVDEVVASSTGNHGAAVAFAGRTLAVPVSVFLPTAANPVKRARIEELGARVISDGADLAAAAAAARSYAQREGVYYLDDATDAAVPAGTATIALEILEQAPETRSIIVPVGDSALIRGIGTVARERDRAIRIIGVQAALAPSYFLSWSAGDVIETATCATIADGLATRTPVAGNVAALRRLVDDMALVNEDELLDAMRLLFSEENVLAEPAGAAATAAALAIGRLTSPTVLLVTGANVAPDMRARVGAT